MYDILLYIFIGIVGIALLYFFICFLIIVFSSVQSATKRTKEENIKSLKKFLEGVFVIGVLAFVGFILHEWLPSILAKLFSR